MFYPNYYPYNMNYNCNYNYKHNNYNKGNNINFNPNYYNSYNEKKDTDSPKSETIPFKDYQQNNENCKDCNSNNNENINVEKIKKINLFGFSLEIDDLIIIGLIILLFLESDKNYALIIILGLILLNVNLSDILNIF